MAYIRTPSGNFGFAIGFGWRSADNIRIIHSQRRSGLEAARFRTLALIAGNEYILSRRGFGRMPRGSLLCHEGEQSAPTEDQDLRAATTPAAWDTVRVARGCPATDRN